MITENELQISNKSFTNKDFQTIYPEILNIAKSLSSRWDPSVSNESDPGIVLLKVLAFIADKNNYNIDKNVLENFMPSATQEASMRKLCDMMGYNIHYYKSATTDVSFTYTGTKDSAGKEQLIEGDSFEFPKLETTITDTDNTLTYTLIKNNITIHEKNVAVSGTFIEGTKSTINVGDSTIIQLSNLDDNNRIYFPEIMVAENGIFIEGGVTTTKDNNWTLVSNLNSYTLNSKIFKFGFDSVQNLPYIEFPSDIANLIGSGLTINYIISKGELGNIKSKTLNTLITPTTLETNKKRSITLDSTNLNISNFSAATDGSNPESINSAYNGFKKTVGTYNNLVTCRDYANAVYNMYNTITNKDLVSNVQVTDRRTDYNYSDVIITYTSTGVQKIWQASNIQAYDLCLYPLCPITTGYTNNTYNKSFTPLFDTVDIINGLNEEDTEEETKLKTICHDFKSLSVGDVYCYKNYAILNAKISTNYKVNIYEQGKIISNVYNALYNNFNARKVDYGYEIPFDSILSVIQNADKRIKNVSLDEPKLSTSVISISGNGKSYEEKSISANPDEYLKILSKNVLAGKVTLFNYNNNYNIDFGHVDANIPNTPQFIDNIKSIGTEVSITPNSLSTGYKLKANETIQIIQPSVLDEIVYSAYVYYNWQPDLSIHSTNDGIISKNVTFNLRGNDNLKIRYLDSNDNTQYVEYTATSIITNGGPEKPSTNIFKANFELCPTNQTMSKSKSLSILERKFNGTLMPFYNIETEGELVKQNLVQTTITDSSLLCYWIVNNPDKDLWEGATSVSVTENNITYYDWSIVLNSGEFFMYTNSAMTELEVLSAGTKLTLRLTTNSKPSQKLSTKEILDIDDINNSGLDAFSSIDWQKINEISKTTPFIITEMSITTIPEGYTVYILDNKDNPGLLKENLNNNFIDLKSSSTTNNELKVKYESADKSESHTINPSLISNNVNQIRSRFDINCIDNEGQMLVVPDKDSTETITINTINDGKITSYPINAVESNTYFSLNSNIQIAGGSNLDMSVTYLNRDVKFDIKAHIYKLITPTYPDNTAITRNSDGFYKINITKNSTVTLPYSIIDTSYRQLFMIYWEQNTKESQCKLTSPTFTPTTPTSTAKCIRLFNRDSEFQHEISLNKGLNIIELNSKILDSPLTLSFTNTTVDSVLIGKLTVTDKNLNDRFNLDNFTLDTRTNLEEKLLKEIRNTDTNNLFYYLYNIPNSKAIEVDDLSSPNALWDSNNVVNNITLEQINLELDTTKTHSIIEIVKSSKL